MYYNYYLKAQVILKILRKSNASYIDGFSIYPFHSHLWIYEGTFWFINKYNIWTLETNEKCVAAVPPWGNKCHGKPASPLLWPSGCTMQFDRKNDYYNISMKRASIYTQKMRPVDKEFDITRFVNCVTMRSSLLRLQMAGFTGNSELRAFSE